MAQQVAIGVLLFAAIALFLTGCNRRRLRRHAGPPTEPFEYQPIKEHRNWVLSRSELEAYMRHDERRWSPRRGGAPTPIHYREVGVRAMQEAYVLDRSENGLRLAVLHNILPKHVIRIKADNSPPDTPWIEVVVCWCNTVEGGYDIGVRYRQPVSANLRLLFG